nr:E3 ubiquitin ligase BIG BROTHER-related-like [Ipomoea batatas]
MATIRELSGYPTGFPSEGKLQIWKFTPGSEGLRFDFNFNPVLDLSSPASAFRFFFDRLSEVDSGVGEEIVGRIATFALDQVGTTNWICGLFLLVVLETVPMRIDDGKKSENLFYTKEVNEKGFTMTALFHGYATTQHAPFAAAHVKRRFNSIARSFNFENMPADLEDTLHSSALIAGDREPSSDRLNDETDAFSAEEKEL